MLEPAGAWAIIFKSREHFYDWILAQAPVQKQHLSRMVTFYAA